jgi:YesN/AraC family two-component response regulator
MERARFLWVQTCCGARADATEFSRHCDVRAIDQQHLWAAVALASAADVICFDSGHPDIDCLKFVADTKARFPSLPIIMLVAQQSADIMLWALRMRIFDVLVKPLTTRDILRCMQRLEGALEARRTQSSRANATGSEAIPNEARYRTRPSARGKLEMVVDYIAKNYTRSITELEVAKTCGMSPFGFSRAFHAAHGVTFRDYLSEHRLAQSKRLLGNSQVSVTDVAAMAGFNDPSYFARLFRKRTGISPSEYRASLVAPAQERGTVTAGDDNEARG